MVDKQETLPLSGVSVVRTVIVRPRRRRNLASPHRLGITLDYPLYAQVLIEASERYGGNVSALIETIINGNDKIRLEDVDWSRRPEQDDLIPVGKSK